MRRSGANPTDVEVTDIINKIDNETGALDFQVIYRSKTQKCSLIYMVSDILFCDAGKK